MEFEYNNLKYLVDEQNRLSNSKIIFDKEKPKTLIKFMGNKKYNKEALMNGYLYLTHASQYNDALDFSRYIFDFSTTDKDDYEKGVANFKSIDERIELPSFEEAVKDKFNMLHTLNDLLIKSKIGTISLSDGSKLLNSLMWAHYSTDNGFAIVFETNSFIENLSHKEGDINFDFYPMNYVEDLMRFNPLDLNYGALMGGIFYSVATKENIWIYEDEWRILGINNLNRFFIPKTIENEEYEGMGRFVHYDKNTICMIVLGEKIFNSQNAISTDEGYKILTDEDKDFINYLYGNFNDKLFLCGSFSDEKRIIHRAMQKIELIKKNDDIFSINPIGRVIWGNDAKSGAKLLI